MSNESTDQTVSEATAGAEQNAAVNTQPEQAPAVPSVPTFKVPGAAEPQPATEGANEDAAAEKQVETPAAVVLAASSAEGSSAEGSSAEGSSAEGSSDEGATENKKSPGGFTFKVPGSAGPAQQAPTQATNPADSSTTTAAGKTGSKRKKRTKQLGHWPQALKDELAYLLMTSNDSTTAEELCAKRGYPGQGGMLVSYVKSRVASALGKTESEKRAAVIKQMRDSGVAERCKLSESVPVSKPKKDDLTKAVYVLAAAVAFGALVGLLSLLF